MSSTASQYTHNASHGWRYADDGDLEPLSDIEIPVQSPWVPTHLELRQGVVKVTGTRYRP